jgi:ketosteroid isomerase-like protein
MSLPDQHEAAIGKGALHKLQLEAREEGVKIHSIKGLEQQIWDCGDFVFEAGRYVASMKSPKLRYLLSDWRKSVTVWARQPDGSLKIKLDSWNPDVIPDANVAPASPVVTVVASGSSSDSDMEAIYAQIKQKESTFHKAFIAHDAEAAIKFYADDAIIMSWGKDAIRGKADISSDIRKSMGEEPLVDMTQHVIHIEGNDKMLFAVNLFTWTFKDKSSGENVTLPGKGVHVWKRQQDGSWKILLDLYNPSVPIQQQGQS